MSKLCLVLGGSGFIGSHLVRLLVARGFRVRVFGRDYQKFQRNVGESKAIEFCRGDITNAKVLESALTEVTDIVYLASSTVPETSMKDFGFDLKSNVVPLIHFLQMIRGRDHVRRFVYFSSGGTVYGNAEVYKPIAESHPALPISSYGLTKLIGEHYVRLCLSKCHVRTYILRPSNAYGEKQTLGGGQGAVGQFLLSLAKQVPITIYGDGDIVRDFIYVQDLARAVVLCLECSLPTDSPVATFNVGSGTGTSIAQLVEAIEKVTGKNFVVQRQPDRGFDCLYNVLDITEVCQALDWLPQVPLEEGIKRTWRWIQGL